MIVLRRSEERGHAHHGWLDSRHTFSFADYHDPRHMGFRRLRVINEDRVRPGSGFGTHGHRDMEIVSYVVSGSLAHRDSMGNGSVLGPGDVQRMTAGTGVRHSEMNPSLEETLHFLQIWIVPETIGLEPDYEERNVSEADKAGRLRLIVSPDGADGSLTIHQDVTVHATVLEDGGQVEHGLAPGRHAWVQVVAGALRVNDRDLRAGDGAAISDEERVTLAASGKTEALLFDLA